MANTWVISGNTEVNNLNGGGWDHGNYASVTFSDVHDGNGGPTSTDAAWNTDNPSLFYNCELTDNAGNTKITETSGNTFANVVDGTYANIEFERNYPDGWYVVEKIDNDSINIVNNPYVSDSGANVKVGGFFSGPAFPHDQGLVTAGDSIKIEGGYTYTLEETWNVNSGIGTAANRITVEGVDSSGVRLTVSDVLPVITTETALASGLVLLYDNIEYYDWWYLDFNGGGAGKATLCVNAFNNDSMFYRWINCQIHNAQATGFYNSDIFMIIDGCEIYNNGAYGLYSTGGDLNLVNTSVHDNSIVGVYIDDFNNIINNCIIYNNGIGVTVTDAAIWTQIKNTDIYDSGGNGMDISETTTRCIIHNTSSSGNAGFGFDFNGGVSGVFSFSYNHSYNNTSGHCDLATTDALWEVFADGNNITGDPLFTDAANGDFIPLPNSPLIGAGTNDTTIGAREGVNIARKRMIIKKT
jgi:hypothetical protein